MLHDDITKPQRQDLWQLMDQDTKTALSMLTKVLCDEPHLLSWKMRRFYAKARGNPTETPFSPGSPLIGELPRARVVETQVVDHDKLLIDELDIAMGWLSCRLHRMHHITQERPTGLNAPGRLTLRRNRNTQTHYHSW